LPIPSARRPIVALEPRGSVALVGDPQRPDQAPSVEEWDRRWAERQKIELDIAREDRVSTILERAAEEFGIPLPDYAGGRFIRAFPFVAFYSDARPNQMTPARMTLTLVDERGRAVWEVSPEDAPFEQIVRAAEAGALEGDPSRIYLNLTPPAGDGIFVDWPTLVQAWDVCWEILDRIDTAVGAAAAAEFVRRKLRNRIGRGRPAVDRYAPSWAQRNGSPRGLAELLARRSWSSEEVARLLGISGGEADAVLGIFGFAQDGEDGRWYRAGDQAAALLDDALEEIWHYPISEGGERVFRLRVDEIFRTGSTAPYPDHRAQDWPLEGNDIDALAAWDPAQETRTLGVLLLVVLSSVSVGAALAISDSLFGRIGAGTVTFVAAILLVRTRPFRRLAAWLVRSL
jgi:hypothetical protein